MWRQVDPAAYLRFISFCCCCLPYYLRFQPGDKSPCSARASERGSYGDGGDEDGIAFLFTTFRRSTLSVLLSFVSCFDTCSATYPFLTRRPKMILSQKSPMHLYATPQMKDIMPRHSFRLAPTSHMEASRPQYFSCMEIA